MPSHPPYFSNLSLADLKPGEQATFERLDAGKLAAARLISLGFTPGAEVRMVQNYEHGPVLVNVRGAFIAIGRGEADKIQVKRSES